uniref:Uncharacterized protein n=1 Tax=Arundo donax TaxID=35708 RepID=A0A0A8Y139_ARUDO
MFFLDCSAISLPTLTLRSTV